ncbi:glutaredoxin family protein [Massilia eurypsychrophila]|jgi:glutaredoxin|uniref:Glutaredoxin family protein n=1 Tax=Massilia eurypsychrophila TaxID=1485217 RepID=A0A2G8T8Q5_9BURK|nr:glutaredoxin family protein [Massilia eurypsychrophila]
MQSMRKLNVGLVLLLCTAGAGAQMFKWTDAKGVVHFSDQPPPGNVAKVERKTTPRSAQGVLLPYALAEAARKSPVVLYTGSPCLPCDQGRALLQQRGIPFTEKTVSSNDDQQKLNEAGGSTQVPLLLVGGARRVGFEASGWNAALTAAAYPSRGRLPSGYNNPPAEPAAPAPPPRPLARDVVPELPREAPPPRQVPPDTPPGFKF